MNRHLFFFFNSQIYGYYSRQSLSKENASPTKIKLVFPFNLENHLSYVCLTIRPQETTTVKQSSFALFKFLEKFKLLQENKKIEIIYIVFIIIELTLKDV